jgi:endonuclease YncB( thermonuclease family)
MANIFDFRKRNAAGPWSRTPDPNWYRKPVRTRSFVERFALVLGFFVLGAGLASAAINYQRLPELAAYLRGERSVATLDNHVPAPHPSYYKPVSPPAALSRYSAVDGDSLRIGSGDTRIAGIDAVELRQTCRNASGGIWNCGRAAHQRLRALVSRGVDCRPEGRDRYGRTLARCYDGERDIGETMVREGLAVDFMGGGYGAAEREARQEKRGIWAGEFELPQDHRRQPRAQR